MARPTKLTDDVQKRLCDALRLGATHAHAAAYAGVSERVFYQWREKFVQFLQTVSKAEAEGAMISLGRINKAGADDWRAAAWLLEHRFPEHYGRQAALDALEAKVQAQAPVTVTISRRYVNDWRNPDELTAAWDENNDDVN